MWRRFALSIAALACLTGAVMAAPDRAVIEHQFQSWLTTDVWSDAKAAKVSRATFDRAVAGLSLDWTLPELEPPGAPVKPPAVEWQAEFGSPGAYFDEGRLSALAQAGAQRLATWKSTLAGITRKYGVPGPILVAVWAKESGFGAAALPKSAIRTLATEAFMGARKETFRPELVAALQIVERGDIAPEAMRSSWAGALGQPQFLPTQFLKYAVDFDGDGRRDIWKSVPDTLASIANYLKEEGWNAARGWGQEVTVPASVACALEGPDQGQPTDKWATLGVARVGGKPPAGKGDALSTMLMPAGRFGPAFLVSENFYVLKNYNYSDLYALYIGHLADRMAADHSFSAPWSKVGGFSRGAVKKMQDALVSQGYDVGKADGLVGFKTRIAIGLWQARHGEVETCFPDASHVKNIR
jgi:lytic murein transglycosylase